MAIKLIDKDAFQKMIEIEVAWCDDNMGASNRGKDFEEGFITGLKQALLFLNNKDIQYSGNTENPE